MKYYFIIFILSNIVLSQNKINVVTSNNLPLSNVNVFLDEVICAKTDIDGSFTLKENIIFKKIKFTHIGFENLILNKTKFDSSKVIILQEKIERLKTIQISAIIEPEKLKIFPQTNLFEKFKTFNNFNPRFGTQMVVYIPNYQKNPYFINKIIVSVKKKYRGSKHTAFLPFLVNLMSVDTTDYLPCNKLLSNDIIARKEKKGSNIVEVKLDTIIQFPMEGLFVLVEIPKADFYKNYAINYELLTPSFELVFAKNSSIKSYVRSYNSTIKKYSQWYENKEIDLVNFRFGIEIIRLK